MVKLIKLQCSDEVEINKGKIYSCKEKNIRYIDPLAWASVRAVKTVLNNSEFSRAKIGLITIGAILPEESLRRLNAGIEKGIASPTIFPAANPSYVAGFVCMYLSIKGPSIHFACDIDECDQISFCTAEHWLSECGVKIVVMVKLKCATVSATVYKLAL